MKSYTTVLNHASFEYEEKKSVFIGEVMPVSTEEDALDFNAAVKKKYPDAKHHVYAYILRENSIMRFSDDREPQGSAGMPVLDSIRKNGCTDVAVVVTRYFGGTLLGVGGLVRAYGAAAVGAINAGKIVTYDIYSVFEITLSYSEYQKAIPILELMNFRVEDSKFTDTVLIKGRIKKDFADDLTKKLSEITFGKAKIEIIDEKFDF